MNDRLMLDFIIATKQMLIVGSALVLFFAVFAIALVLFIEEINVVCDRALRTDPMYVCPKTDRCVLIAALLFVFVIATALTCLTWLGDSI